MNNQNDPTTNNHDLYKAPESDLTQVETPSDLAPASRWARLWGSLIDSFLMMIIAMPVVYLLGGFEYIKTGQEPPLTTNLALGAFGLLVFVIINGRMLITKGQTVGKKVMKTKIVDLDGNLPTLPALFKRYGIFFLVGQIPVAGTIFSIINILFIFGQKKRCVHDYVANTKVINSK